MSVREAAQTLNVSSALVRYEINRGKLRAVRLGDRVLVLRSEIARLLGEEGHGNGAR
jgi:excisionase family DNA binding protein